METNCPSRMFYRICFLETKMRQQLCLQQVATSPCWMEAHWMEAHLVTSGAGGKISVKEPGWGLFTPLRWAGDTISLGFFEEWAVLQPMSMNWSFSKPRPEFVSIWANRWVLVKTVRLWPKTSIAFWFWTLLKDSVKPGSQVWWGHRNSVLVDKFHPNPKVKMKS